MARNLTNGCCAATGRRPYSQDMSIIPTLLLLAGVLVVVVGLIFVLVWTLRRSGPGRRGEVIRYAVIIVLTALGALLMADAGGWRGTWWATLLAVVVTIAALVAMRWRHRHPVLLAILTTLAVAIGEEPETVETVVEAFPDHPDVLRALEPNPRRRPTGAGDFARRIDPDMAPTTAVRMRTLSLPTATVSGRDR